MRGLPGRALPAALAAVLLASPALAAKTRLPALPDSAALLDVVRTLSAPVMEGRGVGTKGLDSAATVLAGRFRSIGLVPAGEEGGYFQRFDVTTGVKVGDPCALEVDGERTVAGTDFQPLGFSANGIAAERVVFAGYGIVAPEYHYDDYAGIDVRDKIVLVLRHEPGEMDSTSVFDGTVNTPHADARTKAIVAREHGALGLLVVTGPRDHDEDEIRPPRLEGAYMSSGLVAAHISRAAAAKLFAGSGVTLAQMQEAIDRSNTPHSLALPESARVTVTLSRQRATIRNIVGRLPGRDSTRVLVVGAHYDHLGYGGESSLAPQAEGQIHPGADDNASGVAGMLGIAATMVARARAGHTPQHDIVFCAFTGEEMGLVGSSHYVDDPARPLENTEAMVNLDMVGRMRDRKLVLMGAGTAKELPELFAGVNQGFGLDLRPTQDGFGPSDHSSFYKRQIPVVALFTGAHTEYHKPSDTWDHINETGLWMATRYGAALVESLDARPRLTYQRAPGDSSLGRLRAGAGYGAYLGTIPDYTQTEGGVLLSGVRDGSPAQKAGLQGGDVIVQFDGVRVENIYDYTYALRSRKPGQEVHITVTRAGQPVSIVAVLGRRP